jgi:large subunit ribosomal protein L6
MSRIGKLPINIPDGVTVTIDSHLVKVKGPKAELAVAFKPGIKVENKDNQVLVTRSNELKSVKSMHGAIRNLINNAIMGVTAGFTKNLELIGTGYRVKLEGKDLNLSLGFSHPVIIKAIDGIEFKVDGQNKIAVSGFDKQIVGQMAANIRAIRPPEPYKGKGIRYQGEVIIKKAGKTAKTES